MYLQSSHQKQTTSWNVSYPSLHSNDVLNCNHLLASITLKASLNIQAKIAGINYWKTRACAHTYIHSHTHTHTSIHIHILSRTHSCFPHYNYIVLKTDTDFFPRETLSKFATKRWQCFHKNKYKLACKYKTMGVDSLKCSK